MLRREESPSANLEARDSDEGYLEARDFDDNSLLEARKIHISPGFLKFAKGVASFLLRRDQSPYAGLEARGFDEDYLEARDFDGDYLETRAFDDDYLEARGLDYKNLDELD